MVERASEVFVRTVAPALAAVITLLGAFPAWSQPVPSCGVSGTTTPLIGETGTLQVTLTNTGSALGFVPAVEVFLPAGFTLTEASFAGDVLSPASVGTFTGGALTNPRTSEAVSGPTGDALYYVEFPLSSLAPSVGAIQMTLTYMVDLAASPTAVDLGATCLFALGTDTLNDPGTDVPPRSDLRTDGNDQTTLSVTPQVMSGSKDVSPPHEVTGSNHPVTFTITIDGASGADIDGFNLTDTLDDRFQLTSLTISPPTAGTINTPATIPPASPGGVIDIDLDPYIGATGTDITITVTGYVPENDASSNPVIDPSTGTAVSIPNAFLLTGVGYTPPGGSLTAQPDISDSITHTAHALLVRQTSSNQTDSSNSPGDTMRLTATVSVSDFFSFDNVGLDTTAGDGSTRVVSSESPAATSVSGDDPTNYSWSIGSLTGNEPGGTRRVYTYDVTIDETYLSSDAVRLPPGGV